MKTIMDALLELLNQLFEGIGDLFEKDHEHNAEFGKATDVIKKSNKGWSVDGVRFTDMDTARRNIAVVAGSGMKKTQTAIFPTILNSESSMLINDNSSELSSTIGYLQSKGADVKVMNLTKKTGVYINPLDGLKGDVSSIRKVAKSLVGNVISDKDFFSLYAEDCLALFMEHVVESEPKLYANLANVYRLIMEYQASPEVIERYMAEKATSNVWRKFLALSQNSEKTLKSILASSLSKLSWLGENPLLCDLTSVTNISFQKFRETQCVLFIQSPPSDAKFNARMIALIFQSFYRFAFSYLPDPEKDLDIMMIQDEFSSMIEGLPDYSQIISNSRKFLMPQAIILQDESQLSPYGELKNNILGNCYLKCYYGAQNRKSLELERLLGSYSYTDKKTKQKKTRPLLFASEIQQLKDQVLVLISGAKPLRLKIKPAYSNQRLRKLMQISSQQESEPVEYSIQYIDLEPYREALEIAEEDEEL